MQKVNMMNVDWRRLTPQPLVGTATGVLGVLALAATWRALPSDQSLTQMMLVPCLVVAIVASYQFPIHIRHRTKVNMTSVPIFLMAALLPAPLAALSAGLGILAGELATRKQTGSLPSDIATHAARRVVIVLPAALLAHLPGDAMSQAITLVGAALLLLTADVVTFPLVLGPLLGERPFSLIVPVARDAYLAEGAQYLLGILGALAAQQNIYALVLLALPTALVYLAFKSATEMHDSTRQLLESMADTVDLRDPYTGGHSRRVTEYCATILSELQLSGPEAALILAAARVHDIGKIAIPDAILKKAGPLDPEERALMETHAERGAEVLRRYADFERGVKIVMHHHEAWNGSGYPHRLAGTAIPFGARVMAVADSFDAMTSDRPYRRGMSAAKAAAILREGRGKQWDATVVDAMLRGISDQLERPAASLLHLVTEADIALRVEASA